MTEAQIQALYEKIEGMRQQLSTFADIVLLELEAVRRKRVLEAGKVHPVIGR